MADSDATVKGFRSMLPESFLFDFAVALNHDRRMPAFLR
jgi:hypothetical protein